MLQIKIKNTNEINPQGTRLYIEDVTGVYSETNLGGYGAPNEERNGFAILPLAISKGTKGDKAISFEPFNPFSGTRYAAIIPSDGWYVFSFIKVPLIGTTLYDVASNKVYKNGKEIVLKDLKGTEFEVATTDTFFIANNSKTKLVLSEQITNLLANKVGSTDKNLVRLRGNYNALRAILQGSIYEFCRGNKYVAQKNIEFLNTNDYV